MTDKPNEMPKSWDRLLRGIVMGVAGCGKTSVGTALAGFVEATYLDGDDLHPAANIEKMSAGIPLDDEDRWPWLDLIGGRLRDADGPVLIGCSALKRAYRDRIRMCAATPVVFIHLEGSRDVIERRMKAREGHFMPPSLLRSQFDTLEDLQADEAGFAVDIDQPREAVVKDSLQNLRLLLQKGA
jgi:carbohydrate kinase (thermoresistant glucokinase family)